MLQRFRFDSAIGTQLRTLGADAAIAALAEGQHGVVSRTQLLGIGVGKRAITHRLERRRLHALYRGVYAVGHSTLGREGRFLAAVVACGPGAVLSYRSAGIAWDIRRPSVGPIEVTAPRDARRPGLHVHRALIPPDERTQRDGVPITTVPRTLLDLAAVLAVAQVERAVERAEALRLRDTLSLPDLLDRYPRKRGAKTLRWILASQARARDDHAQ